MAMPRADLATKLARLVERTSVKMADAQSSGWATGDVLLQGSRPGSGGRPGDG
jgi:hypothetical protein